MAKHCKPCKRKKGKKRKPSAWNKHVMREYRRNKAAGFTAALRRAKKTYRKK